MNDNNNKTVSERLKQIEDKSSNVENNTEKILEKLNTINNQHNYGRAKSDRTLISEEGILLRSFIKGAIAEHFLAGSPLEFEKAKKNLIIFCILLIGVGIISTIFTSLTFKIYSTFSFFENLCAIATLVMLVRYAKLEKRVLDLQLMENSCDIYNQNKDGTWVTTYTESKSFKWIRRLAYVAVILNIIFVATYSKINIFAISSIIFEIIFFGLIIVVLIFRNRFEEGYGMFIFYTGYNISHTEVVTIVWNVFTGDIVFYENFIKTHRFLFEDMKEELKSESKL